MSLKSIALSILLSSCTITAYEYSCPLVSEGCKTEDVDSCCVPKMGKVLFSQQWVDRTGASDKFTIHGFWPDYCDGRHGPNNGCDRQRNYPHLGSELKTYNQTLYNNLNLYWPSFKGDNEAFWSHEWNKHGTCLSTFEPKCYGKEYKKYEDANDYFAKVLNMYHKYNYYDILKKEKIIPGRSYPREAITQAIEKNTDLKVVITCRGRSIREIRTWFMANGKDFKPIETQGRASCPKVIFYPKKSTRNFIQSQSDDTKTLISSSKSTFVLQDLVLNVLKFNVNGHY
ncbi:ribonuclease T2 [Neoconidiobolus thromboides FSU 785]|nr:ribonuclease T2 [Neoconidiobolus thromboides FSU 785]